MASIMQPGSPDKSEDSLTRITPQLKKQFPNSPEKVTTKLNELVVGKARLESDLHRGKKLLINKERITENNKQMQRAYEAAKLVERSRNLDT